MAATIDAERAAVEIEPEVMVPTRKPRLLIGIETRGRTIEEIDATLTRPKPLAAPSA